jgi:hypothetical protein
MVVAYADPPYIGQAKRHYGDDPRCAEVDHEALIADLVTYDGWALSCSSPTLKTILAWCPEGVRVGAWVKPFAAWKKNVNPAYCWEPVIFVPCRKQVLGDTGTPATTRDYVSASITMNRNTHGAKPDAFCYWLFAILGMRPDDTFIDLYPGSGAVSDAWSAWCAQGRLEVSS